MHIQRLAASHAPVFLVNSRPPLFSATPSSFGREVLHSKEPSFSRSYGGILPSSFTTVLSIALVFSTCAPASVSGTGAISTRCWAFLGSIGSVTSALRLGITSQARDARICLRIALHAYPRTTNAWAHLPSCVPLQLSATSLSVRPKAAP